MTGPYRIRAAGFVIGSSPLDGFDVGQAVVTGRFTPTAAYAAVRAVFAQGARLTGAVAPDDPRWRAYREARDALDLTVEDAAGQPIAVRWIHIDDLAEPVDVLGLVVSVHLDDPALILGG